MVNGSPDGGPVTYDKSEGAGRLIPDAIAFGKDAVKETSARRARKENKFF